MYPYALAMRCISDKPDTDTGIYLNTDGAYECPSGMVTVFNASTVKCVSSLAECTGLFVGANKSACVDQMYRCDGYLRLNVYEENGEKLCLTGAECKAKGASFGYSFYTRKSATKCTEDGLTAYIIGGNRRCREERPD